MILSYKAKKNKAVFLLSSEHKTVEVHKGKEEKAKSNFGLQQKQRRLQMKCFGPIQLMLHLGDGLRQHFLIC